MPPVLRSESGDGAAHQRSCEGLGNVACIEWIGLHIVEEQEWTAGLLRSPCSAHKWLIHEGLFSEEVNQRYKNIRNALTC